MSARRPIQVSAIVYGSKIGAVALCNDSTMWSICGPGDAWHRLPEIPTSEAPEKPAATGEPIVMEAGSAPPPAKTVGLQKEQLP